MLITNMMLLDKMLSFLFFLSTYVAKYFIYTKYCKAFVKKKNNNKYTDR
jgi:hypothetical protein